MTKRFSIIFASLAFIGLFILAWNHYVIRSLFLDGSFFLFFMLKEGTFNIENYRYGAVVAEWLPMLMIKTGQPLSSIMRAYSLSYIIYYLVLFVILFFGLKKRGFAWGVLLIQFLMAGASFYWPISELQLGLGWTFLMLGFWDWNRTEDSKLKWISILYLLPITLFYTCFHPLLIFAWFIAGGYILISNRWYRNWADWLFFFAVLGAIFLKNYLLKQPYEESRMEYLLKVFELFPNYHEIPSMRTFVKHIFTQYYLLFLAFFFLIVYWIRKKRWKSLAFIILSFLGYLLLIKCAYNEVGSMFYHENMLLILGMIVALPFAQELVPRLIMSRFNRFAFVLFLIVRLLHINIHSLPFERHMRFHEEQIAGARDADFQKVIVTDVDEANRNLIQFWGSSFETLLMSSMDGPENSVTVIVKDNPDFWGPERGKGLFLTEWYWVPAEELPKEYLNIGSQSYNVQSEAW